MIKFFRNIRQRLLTEKKFNKYLIYAIGEIILVVIGILIALQINNWNELRKDTFTEKEILKGLMIDFSETKSRLKETIKLQNTAFSFGKRLLFLYKTGSLLEKKDSVPAFVGFGALSWWRAEPVTGTYDAMISTGNIELLRNKELRRLLSEFDAELKSGFEDHEYSMDLLNELTMEQSSYAFNFLYDPTRVDLDLPVIENKAEKEKNLTEAIHQLSQNERFFGLLSSRLMMEKNRLERQEKMLLFANNVLEMIELESKK